MKSLPHSPNNKIHHGLATEAVYRLDHKLGRIVLSTHVDDGIGGASTTAVLDWMYAEIIKKGFSFSQQGAAVCVIDDFLAINRELASFGEVEGGVDGVAIVLVRNVEEVESSVGDDVGSRQGEKEARGAEL